MPFRGYLTIEELTGVADAIRAALGGYAGQTRSALLGAVPNSISGLIPEGGPPAIQVVTDLQFLNNLERLTDGTVPLIAFLRMALSLGGTVEAMNPVRRKLSELDTRTTGAPRIDVGTLPETKERIIGRDDMVPYAYMKRGLDVAKAVAKLEVLRFQDGLPHMTGASQTCYLGTGWLIGPRLLITNHHVLNARNDGEAAASFGDLQIQTKATVARFDYDFPEVSGVAVTLSGLACFDRDLDYAISRLDIDRPGLEIAAGPIEEATNAENYIAVNVVQHPQGVPKRFGIRNNLVTAATKRDLRYFTDTDGGSSGSPVLDDQWRVVALHRGSSFAQNVQYQGRPTAYVNLGTQIHAILDHVRANAPAVAAELGLA